MASLKFALEDCGIPFKERHYPYFSLGFMAPWQLDFLTMPHFMELAEVDGRRLIVGFEPLVQEFRLLDVGHTDQFSHLVRMDHSVGLTDDGLHLMEMLQVRRVVAHSTAIDSLVAHLVAKGWGRPPGMA